MSKIRNIIEYLEGTCNTLDYNDITHKELDILSDEIFLCDNCSWWCPVEELEYDNTCRDCINEE